LLPFNVEHSFYPNDPITPRNILVHNSCVQDRWELLGSLVVFGGDSPVPLDTFLYNYFNHAGYWYHEDNFLNYPPGTYWHYANVGTGLVGSLTEAVTDDSFPLYCQQHIFDPLGMSRTSWFYSNLNMNNIAMPYVYSGGQYIPCGFPSSCNYPPGTLKSSLLDLTRFLLMFMQYGELDGFRILDSTTVALMRTVQDTITLYPNAYIGITWWYFLSPYSGRWIWGHTGGWFGTAATMMFCPAENSGAIILTNREVDTFGDLGPMVRELLDWALEYGIDENTIKPANIVTLDVAPNPFTNITNIRYTIPELRNSNFEMRKPTLRIYDASGRLVKSFRITPYTLRNTLSWNGRDDQNRMLGSGVYFVEVSAGEHTESKKVLLIR
jgi:CubicO group peptidase (beta-lactamase class C family)